MAIDSLWGKCTSCGMGQRQCKRKKYCCPKCQHPVQNDRSKKRGK